MRRRKGVLIIECVPKEENLKEGKLLCEFLKMMLNPKQVDYKRVKSLTGLKKTLMNNKFRYIHISSHGKKDKDGEIFLELEENEIYPKDFKDIDLSGNSIVLMGCNLGLVKFCDDLHDFTNFKEIVAPQKVINFDDSSLFSVYLYYRIFSKPKKRKRGSDIYWAYRKTLNLLGKEVKGAPQYLPYE